MSKDKVYKVIITLSVALCVFLIIENYEVREKIIKDKQKLSSIEKVNNKDNTIEEIGFYNIIETLNSKQKVKINNIISKDSGKDISTQINVSGDMSIVRDTLKDIKKKNNFQCVDNIKISRDKNMDISTEINMEFLKNR